MRLSGAMQAEQNLWMDFNSRLDELELSMLFRTNQALVAPRYRSRERRQGLALAPI